MIAVVRGMPLSVKIYRLGEVFFPLVKSRLTVFFLIFFFIRKHLSLQVLRGPLHYAYNIIFLRSSRTQFKGNNKGIPHLNDSPVEFRTKLLYIL